MGRKFSGGPTTTTIRIPLRFKQEVENFIFYLKQGEKKFIHEKIIEVLATVQQAGLIDLQSIAQQYGVSCVDETGRFLEKEVLRLKLIDFFNDKLQQKSTKG